MANTELAFIAMNVIFENIGFDIFKALITV